MPQITFTLVTIVRTLVPDEVAHGIVDHGIVVSDFSYLLPFSNNFPLKFSKNMHSGFTLVHIPNNSACSIDMGL